MKLLELYKKFDNTGVDNIVITDAELKQLKEKLEEVGEFLSNVNLFNLKIILTVDSVDRMLEARKRYGERILKSEKQ